VADRPAGSTDTPPYGLKPDPRSTKIVQGLFAKPSTIAAAPPPTSSEKPVVKPETPPAAEKPATPPAAPVSPSPTPPAAPAVPQKTFQQELDDLRKASAQATMAGPSREAQALMSTRTKNILGPEKLRAGIEGQERVEKMKSQIGMPKVETPKPQAPTPPPAPKSQTPTPPPPPETRQPTSPPPPKSDRSKEYQQAWDNRNNPFAKGRIKDAWSKMTPEEKKAAKEWAKANNKDWKEMNLPEGVDIYDNVLDYLINEGYADTEQAALVIMANMSEEWKQNIMEGPIDDARPRLSQQQLQRQGPTPPIDKTAHLRKPQPSPQRPLRPLTTSEKESYKTIK